MLFDPIKIGPIMLANRIVMAPLTRSRAGVGDVQNAMHATYYQQRATAGLMISEATQISPQGKGYAFTPGIYSPEQVAGWRLVTDAVHQSGGRIFAQLWHVGRISHPDLQPNHDLPVAPSAIRPTGQAFTETGLQPFVTPRALLLEEIPEIVAQYAHAAQCAKQAGFDGVEIHAANGYLLAQFLCDNTNQRTDIYGGVLENRARIILEVLAAVTKVWPSQQVGIRLSPVNPANDAQDSQPQTTFGYLISQLNPFNLAYIHCVESATPSAQGQQPTQSFDFVALRRAFNGLYIANSGYDFNRACAALEKKHADLIAFGRLFIANPDLVHRLQTNAPCAEAPRETWYGGGESGYTDWPILHK